MSKHDLASADRSGVALRSAVGSAAHLALLRLAARPDRTAITAQDVLDEAARAARTVRASGTWTSSSLGSPHVAPLIASGCRMFPPVTWRHVAATEVGTDADLIWADEHGGLLVDEIKTGTMWQLDPRTRNQVDQHLRRAETWPTECHGVRLLTLTSPRRSYLFRRDLTGEVLEGTEFWFGFAAPWQPRRTMQ